MKVSVVIVSWNAREYLAGCLDSLAASACRYPTEVIVVDNASSDGSAEMVTTRYPEVRLIQTGANLGFAKANNIGIRASRGEYLALINSDVKVLPECLTRLVDYLDGHPQVGMAGPRVIGGDGKLQRSCRGFPTVWNMLCRTLTLDVLFKRVAAFNGYFLHHWPQESEAPVDILSGCFWTIRRQALDRVGLLDEAFFMYGEDMDWCKRFWLNGWNLMFVPAAEAIHYGGASSSNSPIRFYIERHRADLRYWKKHHSFPAVLAFFAITFLHMVLRALGYVAGGVVSRAKADSAWYKVKRSVAVLKWMGSSGLKQCLMPLRDETISTQVRPVS